MNEIKWSKKANKQLRKIARQNAIVIYDRVGELATFPDTLNVKRLVNHRYSYRLRVGNYRVFFEFEREIQVINIEEVKKRDERTY